MAGTVYEDGSNSNIATMFLESPSIIVKAMFLIMVLVVFTVLFSVRDLYFILCFLKQIIPQH